MTEALAPLPHAGLALPAGEMGAFLQGFALPLLQGGAVRTQPAADLVPGDRFSNMLAAEKAALGTAFVNAEEQFLRSGKRCWAGPLSPAHFLSEMPLPALLNQLLLGLDGGAAYWNPHARAEERFHGCLRGAKSGLEPPKNWSEAVSRHLWLNPLTRMVRQETDVRYWCGGQHFAGRAVPSRLLAWPRVRRVSTTSRSRAVLSLVKKHPSRTALRAFRKLLERSPITEVCWAYELGPLFRWRPLHISLLASGPSRHWLGALVTSQSRPERCLQSLFQNSGAITSPAAKGLVTSWLSNLREGRLA